MRGAQDAFIFEINGKPQGQWAVIYLFECGCQTQQSQAHKASSEESQLGVTCPRHGGSDCEYRGRAGPISERSGGALAPRLAPEVCGERGVVLTHLVSRQFG